MVLKRGDIVLCQFPFTDLSSSKRRPAIIVSSKISEDNDMILAFITSVVNEKIIDTDLLLSNNEADFMGTGLKKTSIIKLNKIATINISIISGIMGNIDAVRVAELDTKLKLALALD